MERDLTLLSQDYANMPVTLADYIYPAIQKQYVTILTLEAKVLADEDVDAIHKMRVSLRRLRSQMQAFSSILDIPKVMGEKQIGKYDRITRSNHLNWDNWQPIQNRYRQSKIRQELQLFLIQSSIAEIEIQDRPPEV